MQNNVLIWRLSPSGKYDSGFYFEVLGDLPSGGDKNKKA